MKKKLTWILVTTLVFFSFVGCGKKADDVETDSEVVETTDESIEVEELSKKDVNTLEKLMEKENQLDSYSYRVETKLGTGLITQVKIYKSKDWMRMESTVEGLPTQVMLFNIAEGKVYTIMEEQKQVMMIEDPEMFMDPSAGIDMLLEDSMVPEGTELEKVDYKGTKALLLSVTVPDLESGGDMGTKIWYDEAKGVPLAYEMAFGGETMLTEFEYDFSKVSDDMFELPEGYPVLDMGNMEDMFDNMNLEGMEGMEEINIEDLD